MDSPTAEAIEKIIQDFIHKIGEHCDAVQVLCSWNEEGQSKSKHCGSDSWYARIGMSREFLIFDKARAMKFIQTEGTEEDG